MKTTTKKRFLVALSLGLVLASCSTDEVKTTPEHSLDLNEIKAEGRASVNYDNLLSDDIVGNLEWTISGEIIHDFSQKLKRAVVPSECGNTLFDAISANYNNALVDGFISSWDGNPDAIGVILDDYFVINQIAALDENKK